MKEKFAKLVDVKSIITFALVGCVCYLAIAGKIEVSSEFFACPSRKRRCECAYKNDRKTEICCRNPNSRFRTHVWIYR